MLMEVKSHIKLIFMSFKYNLLKGMDNRVAFIGQVLGMFLNNALMIIQWIVLYSLKDNVGGYTFKQVLLLWGIAASTYGVSRFFFKKAFSLSEVINEGKLDAYLVQPKNVLLSAITTDVEPSALGDLLYGYIMLFIYGFTIERFLLFSLFTIVGGIILVAIAVILGSLSFWFNKSDVVSDLGNSLMTNFATYPDGIFKGFVKGLLYTLIPVGIVNYIPVAIMTEFNLGLTFLVIGVAVCVITLAFFVFDAGLKKYSSSNLMVARI